MKIRGLSIKNNILLFVVSLQIATVLLLTILAVYEFTKGSSQIYDKDTSTIVSSIDEAIDLKIKNVEGLIDYSLENINLDDEVGINNKLQYINTKADCKSVYLYNNINNKVSVYPNGDYNINDIESTEWYKKAKNSEEKVFVTNVYNDSITGDKVVTIGKAVIKDGKFQGVMCINYSLKNLFSDISNIKFGDSGVISLIDKLGVVVSCTKNDLIGSNYFKDNIELNEIISNVSGSKTAKINSQKSLLRYDTMDLTKWKIVLQMPTKEYNKSRDRFIKYMIMAVIVLIISAYLGGNVFAREIAKRLKTINDGVLRSSNGDFSEDVKIVSSDEFGEMSEKFNDMQQSISKLISVTKDSVNDVNESSENLSEMSSQLSRAMNDVSSTINEISKGSMESAQSLENLLKNLDDVSNKIEDISRLSDRIESLAVETDNLSKNGLDVIKVVMDKSTETKNSTLDVTKVVLSVAESVKNIAVMNETISEITEQTNLLALNASIEAARAGESGRGFAVVAEEIGQLAEQTASSAKNIDKVINEIVDNVQKAVKKVNDAGDIVDAQQTSVNNAKGIFNDITNHINELSNQLSNVIKFVKMLNNSKENIVSEAENVSSIVEETAAGTQEVTATAEEVNASSEDVVSHAEKLKELSEILTKEINKFKLK